MPLLQHLRPISITGVLVSCAFALADLIRHRRPSSPREPSGLGYLHRIREHGFVFRGDGIESGDGIERADWMERGDCR